MNEGALREPLPVAGRAQRALRKLSTSTRPLVYGGNRIDLLKNGEQYFPRLIAAIEDAKQSIYIESYIFELDDVGKTVSDALAAAAQRGVAVQLLIDGFGSQTTADALIARLRPHGAKVIVFRRTRWWRLDWRLLRRLHRKV
ncbi:MAG: phospholipase D-like domain-containing protein, partial [Burkholderiaceae bacterium]